MQVTIYSRKYIEDIIARWKFPDNTAVISFYDPDVKQIDEDYTRVDYSKVCDDVFYCELDDLDLDDLPEKGYTYDTFFPEADELAEFIVNAYLSRKNIICQCEYGQSRSAGCAAAILEYFYKKGLTVFSDYSYYPNQVIFHKVYDALVRMNPAFCDTYSLRCKENNSIDPRTGAEILFLKNSLESDLAKQGNLFYSLEDAYYQLRHGAAKVFVSLHIDNAEICNGNRMGESNVGVKVYLKYADREIPVIIYIPKLTRYIKPKDRDYYLGKEQHSVVFLKHGKHNSVSFDMLGIMQQELKEPFIKEAIIINISSNER